MWCQRKKMNKWNSIEWFISSNNNDLILFPSWVSHKVRSNKKATTDRISIAFNVFARGIFESRETLKG